MIHLFWHGDELPEVNRRCVASAVRHHDVVVLWCYHAPPRGLPDGVEVRSAEALLPRAEVDAALAAGARIEHVSDAVRFAALAAHGGWWLDCDVLVLRPLPAGDRHIMTVARRLIGPYARKHPMYTADDGDPNISVLRLPPADPLAVRMAAFTRAHMVSSKWTTNMMTFAKHVRELGYLEHVRPARWFAPLPAPGRATTRMLRAEPYSWFGWRVPSRDEIAADPACYCVDLHGRLKHHGLEVHDALV